MTDTTRSDHAGRPDALLPALISLLDIVVLERLAGGAFRRLGEHPAPQWFSQSFRDVDPSTPVTLVEAFPVLDAFLSEAEVFWDGSGFGRLEGEAVVVEGPVGHNLPLAATALALDGRQLLVIQRVSAFDDRQKILQRARDGALAREDLVKRIDGLRLPVARVVRLAEELRATQLDENQQALLARLVSETDSLREVLDLLPKLPPGASPRRR